MFQLINTSIFSLFIRNTCFQFICFKYQKCLTNCSEMINLVAVYYIFAKIFISITMLSVAGLRVLPRQQLEQQHHPVFGPRAPGRAAPHPHGRHLRPPRRQQHVRARQPGLHRAPPHHGGVPQQQPDQGRHQLLAGGLDRGEQQRGLHTAIRGTAAVLSRLCAEEIFSIKQTINISAEDSSP